MEYMTQRVRAGEEWRYEFPEEFQARWIRFSMDTDTKATAWLEYPIRGEEAYEIIYSIEWRTPTRSTGV